MSLALIGYMDPGTFLGGTMPLDFDERARDLRRADRAPARHGRRRGAAIGIYRVAAAQIADLIREVTVERGLDPREFVLHAFGGILRTVRGDVRQGARRAPAWSSRLPPR